MLPMLSRLLSEPMRDADKAQRNKKEKIEIVQSKQVRGLCPDVRASGHSDDTGKRAIS
jgi:hypothetical protein